MRIEPFDRSMFIVDESASLERLQGCWIVDKVELHKQDRSSVSVKQKEKIYLKIYGSEMFVVDENITFHPSKKLKKTEGKFIVTGLGRFAPIQKFDFSISEFMLKSEGFFWDKASILKSKIVDELELVVFQTPATFVYAHLSLAPKESFKEEAMLIKLKRFSSRKDFCVASSVIK